MTILRTWLKAPEAGLSMLVVHGVCGSGEIVLLLKLFGGPEVR